MENGYLFYTGYLRLGNMKRIYAMYVPSWRLMIGYFDKKGNILEIADGNLYENQGEDKHLKLLAKINKNNFKRELEVDSSFLEELSTSINIFNEAKTDLKNSRENLNNRFQNINNFIEN